MRQILRTIETYEILEQAQQKNMSLLKILVKTLRIRTSVTRRLDDFFNYLPLTIMTICPIAKSEKVLAKTNKAPTNCKRRKILPK